jgi:hypothetical protein
MCDRLGERDFNQKYSQDEICAMDKKEFFLKLQECIISYEEEMEDFGLERLYLLKTIKDLGI